MTQSSPSSAAKPVVAVGALVVLVAAFAPWVRPAAGTAGTAHFGTLTAALAIATLLLLGAREWRTLTKLLTAVVGLLVVGVAFVVYLGLGTTDPAIGLFSTLAGGGLVAIAGSLSVLFEAPPDPDGDARDA